MADHTTPTASPAPERPTAEDLARDLAADLLQFAQRDGRDWALWLCGNVEEMVPAAMRRARYAEHLLRLLVRRLLPDHELAATRREACAHIDALDAPRQPPEGR